MQRPEALALRGSGHGVEPRGVEGPQGNERPLDTNSMSEMPSLKPKGFAWLSSARSTVGLAAMGADGTSAARTRKMLTVPVGCGTMSFSGIQEEDTEEAEDAVHDGLSAREALVNLIIALVGAAVCAFPKVATQTGIIAAPVILVCSAVFLLECALLIARSCDMAEAVAKLTPGAIRSYEELALSTVGTGASRVLMFTKNAVMLGSVALFVNFETESIAALIMPEPDSARKYHAVLLLSRFFICLPIFCALSLLTDMKQLSRFAPVGILGVLCEVGGILGTSWFNMMNASQCETEADLASVHVNCRAYRLVPKEGEALKAFGCGMSVFVFGFAVLGTVPNMRSALKEPADMPGVLRKGFMIAVSIYMLVLVLGYLAFGQKVRPNIIISISFFFPKPGSIPLVGLILNILFSMPIFLIVIIGVFEASGTDRVRTPLTPPNIAVRMGLVLTCTVLGWKLPYIVEFIGIMSSIFCVCNNIFFPLLFFWSIVRKEGKGGTNWPGTQRILFHVLVGCAGVLTLLFGLYGSLQRMIAKIEAGKDD